MMSNIPVWIDFLGYLAAVIGVGMAVYLQFIVRDRVPPEHVVGFLAIGISLFFITVRTGFLDSTTVTVFRVAGYVILISLEILGFYQVRNELDLFRKKIV